MPFRRRPFGRAFMRKRSRYIWCAFDETPISAAASGSVDLLADAAAAYGAGFIGVTVMRVIADVQWQFPANEALSSNDGMAIGIQVDQVTGRLPLTNSRDDWLFRRWVPMSVHANTLLTTTSDTDRICSLFIDSKSKRRIDEIGQTLIMSLEATGTAVATANARGQVLLKLP